MFLLLLSLFWLLLCFVVSLFENYDTIYAQSTLLCIGVSLVVPFNSIRCKMKEKMDVLFRWYSKVAVQVVLFLVC